MFRCPAKCTFRVVENFINNQKDEDVISFEPTGRFVKSLSKSQRSELQPYNLRIIKLVALDGSLSVLLTNLFDKTEYPANDIIDLYFRRWEVEIFYRDEKVLLDVERFHSKACNGIKQELYATLTMSIITRMLMVLSCPGPVNREPQFKNAIRYLSSEAAVLAAEDPQKVIEIFNDLLKNIRRVRYYRPRVPRPTQPRVTKKTVKKWSVLKGQKLAKA